MIIVEEWITETREVRTKHLDLEEPCVERGGNSTVHRGVLAQFLGTNLPSKVDLCHACHNDKCSNPKHLYWGTRRENIQDAQSNGTWKTPWDRLVEKYGYEQACMMNSRKMLGNSNAKSHKGRKLSQQHKDNIALGVKAQKGKML